MRGKSHASSKKPLAAMDSRINAINAQIYDKRLSLQPYDYAKDGVIGAMSRQVLRASLRTMKPEQRAAALKTHPFKIAALEQPAHLSGLDPSAHARLREETIRAKYPQDMKDLADAKEAVTAMRETVQVVMKSVEAELKAAGTTVAEPLPPKVFEPSWV